MTTRRIDRLQAERLEGRTAPLTPVTYTGPTPIDPMTGGEEVLMLEAPGSSGGNRQDVLHRERLP